MGNIFRHFSAKYMIFRPVYPESSASKLSSFCQMIYMHVLYIVHRNHDYLLIIPYIVFIK